MSEFEAATLEDVADALGFLNFSDREVWVRAALCIKSDFGEAGFDVWDTWGQQYDGYRPSEAKAVWRSAKMGGGLNIASLFYDAIHAVPGYSKKNYSPEQLEKARAEFEVRNKKLAIEREKDERRRLASSNRVAEVSREILQEHCKAVGTSKYLGLKKIQPCGAAFPRHHLILLYDDEADTIRLLHGKDTVSTFYAERSEEQSFIALKPGCVIVPLLDESFAAQNLQIIFPAGKKLFIRGGRKSGLFFVIGVLNSEKPVVLCEGFATGASIALASGLPVVPCFDCGNLPVVAKKIRQLYPSREVLIAGEDDVNSPGNPGRTKAIEAAELIGARVVFPQFGTAPIKEGTA